MLKIIVPTNFSETAWNATLHAIEYCKILDAELLLLHVFEHHPNSLDTNALAIIDSMESKEVQMRGLLAKVKNFGLDKVNTLCIGGSLFEYIDELNATGSNLVVMGSKGRKGMAGKFFGSNASRLMNATNSTVLIVPSGCRFSLDTSVFCAIDYGSEINEVDLKMINQIVEANDKPILKIIHVVKDIGNTTDTLPLKQFKKLPFEYKEIIGLSVCELIEKHASVKKSRLLVLIRKKKGFLEKIIKRSVSFELTMNAKLPLLVLRAK